MSEPQYRDFELPKLYKYSGLFIIIGLVMLHWSQAMYFVGGNAARIGSLVAGFGLIVGAAFLRARWRTVDYIPFAIVTGAYFIALAMLTKFQRHSIWYEPTQLIFTVVCLILFWAGYILAREKRQDFVSANQWSLVGVGILALLSSLSFLRFVKDISFAGSERGFGGTELNPVGVAYANTCLGLVFLILAILNKNLLRKGLYLLVACVSFFVVLSSASRGAVIWGTAAMVFFFVLNRHRKYLTGRGLLLAMLSVLLLIPVAAILYKTNYAVSERLDILIGRFTTMFDSLLGRGHGGGDPSVNAREYTWMSYLSTVDQWIFFGERGYSSYPHNQWLEIFARFGLLGVPMFVMSVVLFFKVSWSAVFDELHPDVEFSLITTLFMFAYLSSITSLSLQVNRVMWLGFGYLLGYYVQRARRNT
jgi:O-antigen ligase